MPRLRTYPLAFALFATFMTASCATQLDPSALWDFSNPALSRQRFEVALATSKDADEALVLRTQIARSHGLERNFDRARAELKALEPVLPNASATARVRFSLELGRTHASATHTLQDSQDPQAARAAFQAALALAKANQLDALAIDAVHMLAFVDTAPADQLHWANAALAISLASHQADARRWEASIRHNLGYALQQLKRFDEALDAFRQSEAAFNQTARPQRALVARWMQANTLRLMGDAAQALAMQTELETKNAELGKPDVYVFDELALLHTAMGNTEASAQYRQKAQALRAASAK